MLFFGVVCVYVLVVINIIVYSKLWQGIVKVVFGIECKCIVCSSISIMGIMCFVDIVNVSSNVDVVGYKI